jgi:hypothetical protein
MPGSRRESHSHCTIFDDGSDGPDLQLDFTDGTSFTVSLMSKVSVEAKRVRSDGGEPKVLQDYTALAFAR